MRTSFFLFSLILFQIKLGFCQSLNLDFKQCLNLALKNNLSVKSSRFRLNEAEANLSLTKTKKFLKLHLGGYAGIAQFKGGIPIGNYLIFPAEEYQQKLLMYGEIGLYSRLLLYDNKQTSLEIEEKKNSIELAQNQIKLTKSNILFQTAVTYTKAAHIKKTIQFREKQEEILKQLLSKINNYFKVGFLSKTGTEKIELQLYRLKDRIKLEKHEYDEQFTNLQLLLNIPIDSIMQVDSLIIKKINNLITENENQIKNIKLEQAKIAVCREKIKFEKAKRHNSIKINLDTYIRYSSAQSWAIGMGVNWPFWDFGETEALKNITSSQYLTSQTELQLIQKQVVQKIEMSYKKMMLAYERLNLINEMADSIKYNLSLNRIDSLNVEEALIAINKKIDLLELNIQKINRKNEYYLACFNYLKEKNRIEDLLIQ